MMWRCALVVATAAAAADAIVANVRMEALVVGHVFHRLHASVRQQNVILAVRDACVRVAVLRMPKVVSGVRIAHPITELVAGGVLVLQYVEFSFTRPRGVY